MKYIDLEKHKNSIKLLYDWIKNNENFCEYDVEQFENHCLCGSFNFEKYIHFNKGNLYEFFDEQGIILIIRFNRIQELFYYEFYLDFVGMYDISGFSKTRLEMELKGFQEAFNILEDKINKVDRCNG